MSLDLTPLEKALGSLKRAIDRLAGVPADTEVRDSVIQRFEYSFELAWKMLKRQLELETANPVEVDGYSKRQLFRVGGERGLIDDVEHWFEHLEKRNLTTHTYNESTAGEVAGAARAFLTDAVALLARLAGRNHD